MKSETDFMEVALDEARKASWPFGAVLVRENEIIAQAGSGDGEDNSSDPTAHAEVNVIRRASQKLGTGDLSGLTLYASCEPCAMCFSAAWYANIREVTFGSSLGDIQKISSSWGGEASSLGDWIEPLKSEEEYTQTGTFVPVHETRWRWGG